MNASRRGKRRPANRTDSPDADTETVRAAGGVLWRPRDGGHAGPSSANADRGEGVPSDTSGEDIEIAIVHRPRYDDWTLPKGKLEPGEHPLSGACREVLEETGFRPRAGLRLPTTSYLVVDGGDPRTKLVEYWAMRVLGGEFRANHEVDALAWHSPGDALTRLTYGHDEVVVSALTTLPRTTATVLLVRHARAGDRHAWRGDDALRPLDQAGLAQSVRLVRVLSCFAPDRVLAASLTRCVQTFLPLAERFGLPVEDTLLVTEERHAEDPDRTVRVVRDLALTGGVTAVCSQGGVIPGIVTALADQDLVKLGEVVSGKGSAWVLSFHGRTLIAADYLPPMLDGVPVG